LNEVVIPSPPTSLISFYSNDPVSSNQSHIPIIALASGPYIYMYKDSKPLIKFKLPNSSPDPHELEIWESLKEASLKAAAISAVEAAEGRDPTKVGIDAELVERAYEALQVLRDRKNVRLTDRSLKLLSLEGDVLMSYARAIGDSEFTVDV
jgi:hypothetical protein